MMMTVVCGESTGRGGRSRSRSRSRSRDRSGRVVVAVEKHDGRDLMVGSARRVCGWKQDGEERRRRRECSGGSGRSQGHGVVACCRRRCCCCCEEQQRWRLQEATSGTGRFHARSAPRRGKCRRPSVNQRREETCLRALRVCVAALAIILTGAASVCRAQQPQQAEQQAQGRLNSRQPFAIGYLDEMEFQSQCKGRHMDLHLFQFSKQSIRLTQQFADSSGDEIATGSFLGRELGFPASLTDLPVSFQLRSTGHPASHYSGIVYGHMHDAAGEDHAVLQINSHPGNDDFHLEFSNKVYHKSAPYQQLYAVGLTLHGNTDTTAETLTAYDAMGHVLTRIQAMPAAPSHGDTFVGVVSARPIAAIAFDENARDEDPVSIKQLYIGTLEAHLLDDLSASQRRLFWTAFNIFIIMMLAVDMLLGRSRSVSVVDALAWSALWIGLALLFAAYVFVARGRGPALVWVTSYLLEKFLSVDNLFVFLTIFAAFRTPSKYQHKVLSWGIAGAIVLRAVFIFTGVLLVERFSWLLALFGVFLVYTGGRAVLELFTNDEEEESMFEFDAADSDQLPVAALKNNLALSVVGSVIPVSRRYDPRGRFFVREDDGDELSLPITTRSASRFRAHWIAAKNCISAPFRLCVRVCGLRGFKATPLFAVLVIVETTDMVFAADSIPAVLSITQDPFVAYTSNIFAVLGLRALYFALAAAMTKFRFLGPGLGIILLFIGGKLLLVMFSVHVSVEATLFVVLGTLAAAIALSLAYPDPKSHASSTAASAAASATASAAPSQKPSSGTSPTGAPLPSAYAGGQQPRTGEDTVVVFSD